MNRTLGLDSPIKTTTIEKESIRWLRLNKYSKKLYRLAKKMEDEGYDELLIKYHDDMINSLMFPVDSKLKDKIQIILIPRITVSKGNWKGKDELDTIIDDITFEEVKQQNLRTKIKTHLQKNAFNFAKDILEAQKNSNGTYKLLSESGELEKEISFKMDASFKNVPKIGHALVVNIDKVTSGKSEEKKMEDLYIRGNSLMKKAENITDYYDGKINLRLFFENIQTRLRTKKVRQGMYKVQQKYKLFYPAGTKEKEFWDLIDQYYESKNIVDLEGIFEKFKNLHKELLPTKITTVFQKEELEKFINVINNGGNLSHQQPPVYCVSLIKGAKNMDLHTYIYPTIKHIRTRD